MRTPSTYAGAVDAKMVVLSNRDFSPTDEVHRCAGTASDAAFVMVPGGGVEPPRC